MKILVTAIGISVRPVAYLPLAPVSDWHSSRAGTQVIQIDPSNGREDWEAMLCAIQEYGHYCPPDDKIENAIMLFFDPSCPTTIKCTSGVG